MSHILHFSVQLSSIILGFCLSMSLVAAETPPQFQFKQGEILKYDVQQIIQIEEVTPAPSGESGVHKLTTKTTLSLTKEWQVKVDQGTTIMTLKITKMKQKIEQYEKGQLQAQTEINSESPKDRQALPFLDKVVATIKISPRGLIEEAQGEEAFRGRVEEELPFRLSFPAEPVSQDSWQRKFSLVLAPPLGTGEKFAARQTWKLKAKQTDHWVMSTSIALDKPETDPALLRALVPSLAQGEIKWNCKSGKVEMIELTVNEKIKDHAGKGSSYQYRSAWKEVLLP